MPSPAGPARLPFPKKRWFHYFDRLFLISVALPTLAAVIYFGFVASDVYISESRFVVRSPQRQSDSPLGSLLAGSGFERSTDDSYSVLDFVQSRDALKQIEAGLKVREHFSHHGVDLLSRFPGIAFDDGFEAFHQYFIEHVTATYDSTSSITTLEVRAYSAEMSRAINETMLQMAEQLLNNLNARSRQDLIDAARLEVNAAEEKAKAASLALAQYRSSRGVFDPDQQSGLQLEIVSRLQDQLRVTESQLAQVQQVSPNNPQIGTLTAQAERLKKSIEAETGKVLGDRSSLASKAPDYQRLLLDKLFADQRLTGTLAALDVARSEAIRKQLYLERLVQPNLPDQALEPRRIRSTFMVFVLGLVAWGVLSLVLSSVREHAE